MASDPVQPNPSDEVRKALLSILRNAGNYPRRIQHLILGEDLTDLIDMAVAAAVEAVSAPTPDRDELVELRANIPRVDALIAERDSLRAAVSRVRELHYDGSWPFQEPTCAACRHLYPCPTFKALDGEQQ